MSARIVQIDDLIGAWELVSFEATNPHGEAGHGLGDKPIGLITYSKSGHMSVTIASATRDNFKTESRFSDSDEEAAGAYRSYFSYFGTFELDAVSGRVVHHVTANLFPNLSGTTQFRSAHLAGDILTLAIDPPREDGVTATLVWRKARILT